MNDIRNLRAEGHTYETIRLALLDAGVSVSLSTVIREAKRPPTQWELEYARAEQAAAHSAPAPGVEPGSEFIPEAVQATTAPPSGPASGNGGEPNAAATGNRPRVGLLASLFRVLRRLRGTGSVT